MYERINWDYGLEPDEDVECDCSKREDGGCHAPNKTAIGYAMRWVDWHCCECDGEEEEPTLD